MGDPVGYYLLVTLRGNADPMLVKQASREAAFASVRFAAELLRKAPSDRACCWAVTLDGIVTKVSEAGVDAQPVQIILAAFDPREVVAVQMIEQRGETTT